MTISLFFYMGEEVHTSSVHVLIIGVYRVIQHRILVLMLAVWAIKVISFLFFYSQVRQSNILHVHQVDFKKVSIAHKIWRFLLLYDLDLLPENIDESIVLLSSLLR